MKEFHLLGDSGDNTVRVKTSVERTVIPVHDVQPNSLLNALQANLLDGLHVPSFPKWEREDKSRKLIFMVESLTPSEV